MMKKLFFIVVFSALILVAAGQDIIKLSKLKVEGTLLVNEEGEPVILRGISYGWHTWWPRFYNEQSVQWFKDDWKCSVIRCAMGIEPDSSYLTHREKALTQTEKVIDGAIKSGVYVLIDWHSHNMLTSEAKEYFSMISKKYGKYPNIIYEIYNEPIKDSWEDLKAYANEVIPAIRANDPDNVILMGCPHWDQDIHIVADSPLTGFNNIMYTVHFYADTHKKWLRDRCDYAIEKNIPIFISESAGMSANGNGALNYEEWDVWINWCETNKVSWIVWMVGDKNESDSFLKPSASSTGNWTEKDLTESGIETRKRLIKYNQ